MPLPSFISTSLVPLNGGGLAPAGGAAPPPKASAGLPATPAARQLPFTMQAQEQTFWCWSAVSVSVSNFYTGNGRWTQCALVNDVLAVTDACDDPCPPAANIPYYLDDALAEVGHMDGRPTSNSTDFAGVASALDRDLVICARIQWADSSGHFVSIVGYRYDPTVSPPVEDVDVADPGDGGTETMPHATLVSNYQGTGSWSHSYSTRP